MILYLLLIIAFGTLTVAVNQPGEAKTSNP
jgi:hypothetical protein